MKKILASIVAVVMLIMGVMATGCTQPEIEKPSRKKYVEFHIYESDAFETKAYLATYTSRGFESVGFPYCEKSGRYYCYSYDVYYEDTQEPTGEIGGITGWISMDDIGTHLWKVHLNEADYYLSLVVEKPKIDTVERVNFDPEGSIGHDDSIMKFVYAYDGERHMPQPYFEYEGERVYCRNYRYSVDIIEVGKQESAIQYLNTPGRYSICYRLGQQYAKPGICCEITENERWVTVEIVEGQI